MQVISRATHISVAYPAKRPWTQINLQVQFIDDFDRHKASVCNSIREYRSRYWMQ